MKRPNGSGTVYKLQGHRRRPWIARKGSTIIGYYATKHEALEALESVAGKPLSESYNLTFAEVFEFWSAEHFRKGISQQQKDEYNRSFKRMEKFHNEKMRDLHVRDYQQFCDNYPIQTYASLIKIKEFVIQMCRYAMREEIITVNYGQFVNIPQNERKEALIFSDIEIEKLKADDTEIAKAIVAMIYTGLRIGEFCLLPMTAYHETYIVAGVKTEAGRNRTIPLSPTAKKYLDYFVNKARETGSDLIIPWQKPKFRYQYRKCLDRLGIEYKKPHTTRHTFASLCRRQGVPPEALKKIMGHANYETTANIYVHSDAQTLIDDIQVIG